MVCNDCDASNENDAAFCINCGEPLSKLRIAKKLFHRKWFSTFFSDHKIPFLQAVLDTSFSQLVSVKVIKLIYSLSILSAGLIALLFVIALFRVSLLFGILAALIGAPLIFLLIALYSRILLELILVNFHRADKKAQTERQPESPGSMDNIEWNF